MKIGYFSDLHTEFLRPDVIAHKKRGREMGRETFALRIGEAYADADVIVAAGDIGTGEKVIAWLKLAFPSKPVIFVPGNHEHWSAEIHSTHQKMAAETKGSNIHFFHDGGTIVIDGVMFCAATLWTDYALTESQDLVMECAASVMTDFNKIRVRHLNGKPYSNEIEARRLHPLDLLALHRTHIANIKTAMARSFEQDMPLVVVTHHAPSAKSLMPNSRRYMETYVYKESDPYYASHLDHLMLGEDAPNVWIHGHTHIAVSYTLGHTSVRSNPKGYLDGEDTGFVLGKLIEIPTS